MQAWTALQKAEAPKISRQLAHESDKLVRSTHRLPLPRLLSSIGAWGGVVVKALRY